MDVGIISYYSSIVIVNAIRVLVIISFLPGVAVSPSFAFL